MGACTGALATPITLNCVEPVETPPSRAEAPNEPSPELFRMALSCERTYSSLT